MQYPVCENLKRTFWSDAFLITKHMINWVCQKFKNTLFPGIWKNLSSSVVLEQDGLGPKEWENAWEQCIFELLTHHSM